MLSLLCSINTHNVTA